MRAEMMTEIVWQVDEEVNWLRQDWWGWRNESMTKLWQTVFTQYRNVTDGRTDRRTDLLYQYRASDRVCWRAIKREEALTRVSLGLACLCYFLFCVVARNWQATIRQSSSTRSHDISTYFSICCRMHICPVQKVSFSATPCSCAVSFTTCTCFQQVLRNMFLYKNKATQLSQRGRATLRVVENLAVTQDQ